MVNQHTKFEVSSLSRSRDISHTHTTALLDFVQGYPGEPVGR